MKVPRAPVSALVILVDRLCFDRYKIDYSDSGTTTALSSKAARHLLGDVARIKLRKPQAVEFLRHVLKE